MSCPKYVIKVLGSFKVLVLPGKSNLITVHAVAYPIPYLPSGCLQGEHIIYPGASVGPLIMLGPTVVDKQFQSDQNYSTIVAVPLNITISKF